MLIGRKKLFLFLAAALVFCCVSFAPIQRAYADYTVNQGEKCQDGSDPTQANNTYTCADSTKKSDSDNVTTCAIEKIGWILCPVIEISGKIGDQAFNMLAKFFLQTEPELVANDSGTKIAWDTARNLANIMFIMAFLAIIISQVTGRGIDNYGIKRMLPRLIIAAIAVNVSYYICQLMVDLSNIAGWEIKNFLVQTAQTISDRAAMPIQTGIDNQTGGGNLGTLATIAIGVLALGVVIYLLPALLSIILFILVTCLVIVIILLLRKAIIVLLVVVSPIAFVLYLLPNTERLFNRWLKMFGQLLMVFPVVSLLFGGGQLASAIVLVAGSHGGTQCDTTKSGSQNCSVYADSSKKCIQLPANTDETITSTGSGSATITTSGTKVADAGAKVAPCGPNSTPFLLGLTAAGIAVAPLLAVYSVLKGALSAAGAIGGMVQNVSKPMVDRARKRRDDDMDYLKNKRSLDALRGGGFPVAGGMARRNVERAARNEYAKSRLGKERSRYIAENATDANGDLTGFGRRIAGGHGSTLEDQKTIAADALNAQRQQEGESVKAEHAFIDSLDEAGLAKILDGAAAGQNNDARVAAALERFVQIADKDKTSKYVTKFAGKDAAGNAVGESLASRTLGSSLAGEGYLKAADVDGIRRGQMGGKSMDDMALQNILDGQYSPDAIANSSKSELDYVRKTAANSAQAQQILQANATKALSDGRLNVRIKRQATVIDNIMQNNWT